MNNNRNSVLKLVPVQNGEAPFISRHMLICGFDQDMNVVKLPNNILDEYEKLFQSFIQFPQAKYRTAVIADIELNRDSLKSYFESLANSTFFTSVTLVFDTNEADLRCVLYIDDSVQDTYTLPLNLDTHNYLFDFDVIGEVFVSFSVTPTTEKVVNIVKYIPSDSLDLSKNRFIDTTIFQQVNVSDTHKPAKREIVNETIKYVLAYTILDIV